MNAQSGAEKNRAGPSKGQTSSYDESVDEDAKLIDASSGVEAEVPAEENEPSRHYAERQAASSGIRGVTLVTARVIAPSHAGSVSRVG